MSTKDDLGRIDELDVQSLSDDELESVAGGAPESTDVGSCSCSCCAATATNHTKEETIE